MVVVVGVDLDGVLGSPRIHVITDSVLSGGLADAALRRRGVFGGRRREEDDCPGIQ